MKAGLSAWGPAQQAVPLQIFLHCKGFTKVNLHSAAAAVLGAPVTAFSTLSDELRALHPCPVLQMMAYDHESKQVALKKLQKAFLEPLEVKHMTLKAFRCGLKQLCRGCTHRQAAQLPSQQRLLRPKWISNLQQLLWLCRPQARRVLHLLCLQC